LLAFAAGAGALVYVAATHLLPHAEGEPRRLSELSLIAGIGLAVGIVLLEPW
jgi:hypothetical protein